MYQSPNQSYWQGRIDGTETTVLRWHQIINLLPMRGNLSPPKQHNAVAILGFCSDEGVRRNKGRVGAFHAPAVLRKVISNFPAQSQKANLTIYDAGDCVCIEQNLEQAQETLAEKVALLLQANYYPMLLGGGHEITFGHFQGVKKAFPQAKIGMINFDAHFDIRPVEAPTGASSGTGFWQIAQEEKDFNYLVLGIQENSNTQYLFDLAGKYGVEYVLGSSFNYDERPKVLQKIQNFINKVDIFYLTICLDVFAAPFAPGVSALAYNGIFPDKVFQDFFHYILASPKLKSMDIAELNPTLDIDNRTARLAASFIFEYVKSR
ncbi:formimidoylglutamase [Thermoflexibacter ruber]|uniref:Formimidoylglutamase n=1 Tax=Thermoflexibacter ruber TaxID=1003 RepID=A0A1I2JNC9_9BACT|nr:formimidoylglutamase [Thermoflexibacter ruber]SFF54647.1 formiminoglutamase [Thermoflexibacter ruber]